ncbi:DUF5627 domain-containing protein [Bacteroides sp. 51]|uniref:DUF5627 domain-containing protein n=1 Tax=Bacteroides sp. 51 TaxID=2302938 RepID=UPI001EF238A1|nr:DUF5627 domain-containing protein [Bacteroides sp. 51]
MKRTKYIFATLVLALTACQNSDIDFPDFDYRTVYFATQTPVRTLVLGEDPQVDNRIDNEHKCVIKATTGGGYSNSNNIVIRYAVDNSMVENLYFSETGEKIYAMPVTYYNLSSDQMEVPSGEITGGVTVEFTQNFFNDKNAITNRYVIPLRMTHVESADSILRGQSSLTSPNRFIQSDWNVQPKDYVLYCVKYINPWHAHYLRRGIDEITGAPGYESLIKTNKRHAEYVEKDETVMLTTSAYRSVKLSLNAKDEEGTNIPYTAEITFDEEGRCTVASAEPDKYSIAGTGQFVEKGDKKSWGGKDRNVLYLDYTVELKELTCHTLDTLVVHYRGVTKEEFTPEYK